MIHLRRAVPLLCLAALSSFLLLLRYTSLVSSSWRTVAPRVGLGELLDDGHSHGSDTTSPLTNNSSSGSFLGSPQFQRGVTKPAGSSYSRALVLATTTDADLEWLDRANLGPVTKYVYVADNASAPLHPPKNKGHEAMIYFTHIIDHFDSLEDVNIFMHAHQFAWHNNELLNHDASEMIRRLSPERVTREGYMNMRCEWYPGCPAWLKPGTVELDGEKQEQQYMAISWATLFPDQPIPQILAQPCCSQLALSRERIQSAGLEKFKFYRNWLLATKLRDSMSGRIWEYLWQVIFTGQSAFCPSERACYCDGFGACFQSDDEFRAWFALKEEKYGLEDELNKWNSQASEIEKWRVDGNFDGAEAADLVIPTVGEDVELSNRINELNERLEQGRLHALELGTNPRMRAVSAGRVWREGDGY